MILVIISETQILLTPLASSLYREFSIVNVKKAPKMSTIFQSKRSYDVSLSQESRGGALGDE